MLLTRYKRLNLPEQFLRAILVTGLVSVFCYWFSALTGYALLAHFARHEGKVSTNRYLLREIWGPGYINQSKYLRASIAQIRKKIENGPNLPEWIVTESGIGYRFIGKE
jgi:hypothetical protein